MGVVGTLGIQKMGKTLIVKAAKAYVNTVYTAKAANAARAAKAGKDEVCCGSIYLLNISILNIHSIYIYIYMYIMIYV